MLLRKQDLTFKIIGARLGVNEGEAAKLSYAADHLPKDG
jgi:hypothetical protein